MITPAGVPTLRDYGRMIRDGWALILAATILCLGGAWLATSMVAPTYSSSSRVFVTAPGPTSPRAAMEGNRSSLVRVESYVQLATAEQVLRRVILDQRLPIEPADLKSDLVVLPTPGSALIEITAVADTADGAQGIANSVALNLIQLTEEIDLGVDGPVSAVTLIDPASLPRDPIAPKLTSNLILGGGMGIAVSVVLVLAAGIARDAISSRTQIEAIMREPIDNAGRSFR